MSGGLFPSEWRLISAAAGPALCELHVEQQAQNRLRELAGSSFLNKCAFFGERSVMSLLSGNGIGIAAPGGSYAVEEVGCFLHISWEAVHWAQLAEIAESTGGQCGLVSPAVQRPWGRTECPKVSGSGPVRA